MSRFPLLRRDNRHGWLVELSDHRVIEFSTRAQWACCLRQGRRFQPLTQAQAAEICEAERPGGSVQLLQAAQQTLSACEGALSRDGQVMGQVRRTVGPAARHYRPVLRGSGALSVGDRQDLESLVGRLRREIPRMRAPVPQPD